MSYVWQGIFPIDAAVLFLPGPAMGYKNRLRKRDGKTAGSATSNYYERGKRFGGITQKNVRGISVKKIYVCSPYHGDEAQNTESAIAYCRDIALRGDMPVAPHIYFTRFLSDDNGEERRLGIDMGLELLKLCDEMWVYGRVISEGMAREIAYACERRIPMRFCDSEGRETDKWHLSYA